MDIKLKNIKCRMMVIYVLLKYDYKVFCLFENFL